MNERQRLLAVLNGNTYDRLPWFADLQYLYSSMEDRGTLEDCYKGKEGYLEFHKMLGAGVCFYSPRLWSETFTDNVSQKTQNVDGQRFVTIETPIGSVSEISKYMPKSHTWVKIKHFVRDINDLKIMAYAYGHREIVPDNIEYKKINELWGPYGYPVGLAPLGVAPIQRIMTRWSKLADMMDIYIENPEELKAIFADLEEYDSPIFEILCNSSCCMFEFPDNLSAEITGRNFFERYNMPYYTRRISQLHKAGKKVGIHNDGTMRGILDLLGQCKFDFVEALTPAPIGDICLEKLREEAGSRLVLWGGIPGAIFSPVYSDEQFESHLQKAVSIFKADGKCVLGVADQVPPDGLLSRIKRVREVIGS